jgi:hypothetical protein
MLNLLFPKWFPVKETEQAKRIDYDKEYAQSITEYYETRRKLEMLRYKDCSLDGLANAFGMLHLTDQNHTENITLIPDGIKMTFKYFNSESGDKACTAKLHGVYYDEKIYGSIDTPEVLFFIGDDVAILPALKIAIVEFIRQQTENGAS